MADQDAGMDFSEVTPEQFAQLVSAASDDQIKEVIKAVGTKPTLDRIFASFPERFKPEQAKGVDAEIQFVVTDDKDRHPYVVAVKDGTCDAHEGESTSPKTSITTDLVSFVKLVTGKAQGVQLFMAGQLRVGGDLMFSQRIMNFFEPPSAG